MKKVKLFFSALFTLVAVSLSAQSVKVTGAVIDASNGEPVAGAAVQLKGSKSTYALSNDLGEFSISVPSDGILVVGCMGYIQSEVPVGGKTNVRISLRPDAQILDDVIVVAYGTVRREANTGSVTSVKNEQLAQVPATSVDKMLSGKMAGVTITSGSGQPGSTSTIRVRGTSSINAGNEPLWVIDGIPVMSSDYRILSNVGVGGGSSTTFLNPNDIESITVLKDAAAASVYGSRAANGVILVTTKSGKSGQARFTARAKFGAQQLINDNNYRPLTGQELLDYRRVCAINAGYNPDDPSSEYYYPQTLLENGTTNWYKELTRIGSLQEYEINASGGNDKAAYYSSLAYHKNEGVFYGVDYQRITARINADYKLNGHLKTGAKISLSYADSNSGQMGDSFYANPVFAMQRNNPWTPVYNEDGSYNVDISENSDTNPLAIAEYDTFNDKDYRLQGNIYLEWKPIRQLTFKTNNGLEFVYVDSKQYWSPETHKGVATLFKYWSKDIRLTTSNTVTYDDKFGEHSLRLMAGQEAMTDTYDYLGGYSPNVDPLIPYPSTSTAAQDQVDYFIVEETLMSFFGVADYNYQNKYYFQASARADGSSLFGASNKWGVFWSVGASWNIDRESWMNWSKGWLSALKLRASYGVNGNNNISAYRAYGVYSTTTYANLVGMYPSRPENPNLSWEKNKTWNAGLDFGFIDGRITGSIDVYSRKTTDMLLSRKVPYTTGFGSNLMNIGSIRNNGVELQLDGVILNAGDWSWTAGANIAFNRSKVLNLADSEYLEASDSRSQDGGTPVRIVKGKSLYTFYLRDWYGVNPSNGNGIWYDSEGKLTSDVSKARYIYVGSPEPKATGGFNTTVSWKGLSLSAYFEFVAGNKVVVNNSGMFDGYSMSVNTSSAALNYWKNPGDNGVSPKPVAENPGRYYVGYSTRFLQDGSYTRIKDITLSYSLPEKVLKAIRMNGVRVYVSALNPYTFHNVTAMDPELGPVGYTNGYSHPMVKSVVGGVEVSF